MRLTELPEFVQTRALDKGVYPLRLGDRTCFECERTREQRHWTNEQTKRQYERWKPLVRGWIVCSTCGTWTACDFTDGGFAAMGDWFKEWLWADYGQWWRAGRPQLHASRGTRVPVKPKGLGLLAENIPDVSTVEIRSVPHEWRS